MTLALQALPTSENDTITTAKNATCNCSYCNANLLESPSAFQTMLPFHDFAVLTGGGGTVTPAQIGLNNAAQLIHGYEWGDGGGTAASISFSFPATIPHYYDPAAQERTNYEAFSDVLKTATRDILAQISTFANITFTEVSGEGDIVFGQAYLTTATSNPDAYTYYPDQGAYGGDVWLNNRYNFDPLVDKGEVGNYILMHEIGHSLGLMHTFSAGLTGLENTEKFSVMSYDISNWGADINANSYMLYDIAALQGIYGANTSYNSGNNTYILNPNAAYTIWDGGGIDTLNSSAVSSNVILHMEQGGFSSVGQVENIAIAYGTAIENAITGAGNDIIYGNESDNRLNGGAGADILNGASGYDTADYSTSALAVKIDLFKNTVSGGTAQGDKLVSIENIIGSNNADERDYLWGDNNSNALYGMAGKDVLEGGSGADKIDGGDGWDYARYIRSTAAVTINLETNINTGGDAQGDKLHNIEAVTGSAYDDTIIGGSGNDYLRGENGNDTLFGNGGYDQLIGGDGNDTYLFKSGHSSITEIGSGIDTIIFNSIWTPFDLKFEDNEISFKSTVDVITFDDISLIEWFSFSGYSAMSLDTLISTNHSSISNTHTNQTFIGTSTIDTFQGLGDSDTVDYSTSPLAVRIDLLNGSNKSGYAAGDVFTSIENLIGSDNAAEHDYLWGNNGENALYGLNGDDFLEGGLGADTLDGGSGWDYVRYTRSVEGVHINLETNINTDGDAQGDKLYNIEAILGSSHNDTFTGSNADDYLKGEDGNDTLYGGNGLDRLFGGNGADTFEFRESTAYTNADIIKDFSLSQGDKIDISDLLHGFDPISSAITDFVKITTSGSNSTLFIDSDGGANHFVQIATISNVTGLTDEHALLVSGNLII